MDQEPTLDQEQVRRTILAEHAELRAMLDGIESLAGRFERGETAAGEPLRQQGRALFERFAAHIDLEDRILTPALQTAGPEGDRRAARLAHEHHEQRELLSYLLARLRQNATPTLLISRELRHFVEYVRQDMAHEEETMLSRESLGAARAAGSK